ncbi:MAG: sulfatase-like hydrolase/transferase [Opitutaceae bacterium]|jgi:arylsulfatase A-like enzyme|nr:sulfatase-like hydrolase/transferase [Opitutaceae bacterium]
MNRPNIIVFFTDQQRWDTLGLNGNPLGLTPHLDRLARRGAFFSEAVTPQPVCGPARSCLQTGQYATTTGVHKNGPGLKPHSPKLAELFNAAGYRTGYIGKWHLSGETCDGATAAVSTANRGGYQDWLAANAVEAVSGPYTARLWDNDNREVRLPGYRSDAMTDAAIRYLHQRAQTPGQPFLLYLSLLEPHFQNTDDSYPAPRRMEHDYAGRWLPPDLQALGGSSARDWAGYCAMIKRIDDALARLMDALESTGQADTTTVAFISDHGCHFKTRNNEYKRSPHESSVRVPLALWGTVWDGGGEHTCPASLVDLAPTLLDTAGITIPPSMQGRSLLPVIRGDKTGRPPESYIQFGDGNLPPGRALRTSRWKYAVTADDSQKGNVTSDTYRETHLYDLQTDPYELSNLIASRPHESIRRHFRERLTRRLAETGEPPATLHPAPPDETSTQRTVNYPGHIDSFPPPTSDEN